MAIGSTQVVYCMLNKLLNLTVQASQLLMSRFILKEINIHIKSQVSKLEINNMPFLHAVKELWDMILANIFALGSVLSCLGDHS